MPARFMNAYICSETQPTGSVPAGSVSSQRHSLQIESGSLVQHSTPIIVLFAVVTKVPKCEQRRGCHATRDPLVPTPQPLCQDDRAQINEKELPLLARVLVHPQSKAPRLSGHCLITAQMFLLRSSSCKINGAKGDETYPGPCFVKLVL